MECACLLLITDNPRALPILCSLRNAMTKQHSGGLAVFLLRMLLGTACPEASLRGGQCCLPSCAGTATASPRGPRAAGRVLVFAGGGRRGGALP